MRALALAVAIVIAAAAVARADELRTTPTGFDHTFHDRNLIVKNIGSLPCARCHVEQKGKLVGKPGHSACFGACHGAPPTAPARGGKLQFGDRAKVCMNCHAEATQAVPYPGRLTVSYPPYGTDPDFNISFGHKQHGAVACTQCHDMRAGAKPARATHSRCAGCHDGTSQPGRGPAMSKCGGCHPQAIGKPQPPELASVRDTVTATFSHAAHAARNAAGKDCLQCHKAIQATDDTELPRPTTQTCAVGACHDGKAAFATTASCTRCHDKVPDRFEVERPTSRFLHVGFHADVVAKRPCGACHPLGPRGDTLVASHSACVECHASDFASRKPVICGACHNATEPWRPLVADRGPADTTEFGATLDHAKHTQDCARCHTLRTQSAQLRPPRGHAACTGAGCHVADKGPAPTLATCDGCHHAGLATARQASRLHAPWSVRAAFNHATHAASDGKPVACTSCHTMLGGPDLVALPTPAKSTCAPCHDAGKVAFKLTGTTCGRCHPKAAP
jgi:c(7)-type cytochrome triheme protein